MTPTRDDARAQSCRANPQSEDMLIGSRRVREICGDVSKMQLWRWLNDARYADLMFPQPCPIGRRNYWKASAIREFVGRQMTKPKKLAA
jgi:predicted DNA-binding transcriptional regulator AlpA